MRRPIRNRVARHRRDRLGWLLATTTIAALSFAAVSFAAPPTGSTDLKITKTASASSLPVGSTLTYTIVVENLGPETATGVVVTDPLPNQTDFVSATTTVGSCATQGQKLICPIGVLEAGPNAKVSGATLSLKVIPSKEGPLSNTASVAGDQSDPVSTNNQSTATTEVVAQGKAPTPSPGGATCRGVPATIVGTTGADNLVGSGGRDVIVALGGNDTIVSLGGRDLICAGSGNDYVRSGSAADRVFGAGGKDRLIGRGGPDVLKGGAGNDVLKGGPGSDRIRGGRGTDTCRGGPGADSIRGCER